MNHKSFLIIFLFACCTKGFAQQDSRICVTFEKNSKHIEVSDSEDSSPTVFNIIRSGFETKEQRKAAKQKFYSKNTLNRIQPTPSFYINLITNQEPEKFEALLDIPGCTLILDLETYRKYKFEFPEGVGGSKVYIIQKIRQGKVLRWSAYMMAHE